MPTLRATGTGPRLLRCRLRGLVSSAILLLLLGCSAAPPPEQPRTQAPESNSPEAEELLTRAGQNEGEAALRLFLEAAELLAAEGSYARLLEVTALPALRTEDPALRERFLLLRADAALQLGEGDLALSILEELPAPDSEGEEQDYLFLLAESYLAADDYASAVEILVVLTETARRQDLQTLSDRIWLALNQLDEEELAEFSTRASSYQLRGWIELARSFGAEQISIRSQLNAIERWREIWNRHLAISYLPSGLANLSSQWDNRPQQVALILPLQQAFGVAIQEGFLSAYYAALEVSSEVPRLKVYDSSGLTSVNEVYDRAVAEGAEMVIGPVDKALVNELHARRRLPVPTLALNYAESEFEGPRNLYQFGLAPEDEIRQIASLAWQAGYRNAAVLTPNSQDYLRLQQEFTRSWNALGGETVTSASFGGDGDYADVVKRVMAIDDSEARAQRLLDLLPRSSMQFTPRRRGDIDFLFLIANPRQGRQIKPTLAFYFAEQLPVLSMPSIYDGLDNQSANLDLNGVTFVDAPWLLRDSDLKTEVSANLRSAQGPLQRLRAMGIDSFLLSARLQQFDSGQISLLRGTTGTLNMSADGQIRRRLPVARFEDGRAILLQRQVSGDD